MTKPRVEDADIICIHDDQPSEKDKQQSAGDWYRLHGCWWVRKAFHATNLTNLTISLMAS